MDSKAQMIAAIQQMPEGLSAQEILDELQEQFATWKDDGTFIAELNRRVEEIESGKVQGIPAEEVSKLLQRRLQEHLSGKDPGIPAEEVFAELRASRKRT
jgi:hypothetical protein